MPDLGAIVAIGVALLVISSILKSAVVVPQRNA